MSASFDADDAVFRVLESRLSDAPGLMSELAANLGEECVNLVREGFEDTADPYGAGWKGTKRGNKPLHGPTGDLRTAWKAHSSGTEFGVSSGVGYSNIHQGGAPKAGITARKMVPDKGDIPGKWEKRFDEVTEEFLDDVFPPG